MRISRPSFWQNKHHFLSICGRHPPRLLLQRRIHLGGAYSAVPRTSMAATPAWRRTTIATTPFFATATTTTTPRSTVSIGSIRWHGGPAVSDDAPTISVTFLQPDGTTQRTVPARVGESLLQTAHRNEIDLEGACEGVCACSTCHLILPGDLYDQLPEPSEDEEDMLDMAFGLTETSRLGCQITVTPAMDGVVFEMPKATRNFYVDGHKPKPH